MEPTMAGGEQLWPLMWWENPWVWGIFFGVLVIVGAIYVLYARYCRLPRVPRSLTARVLYQLKLLDRLNLEHEGDRRYACVLLMQLMREASYYLFGVVHTVMTDEEFFQHVQNRELPGPFQELVERVHGETSKVKFACGEAAPATIIEIVRVATIYFESVSHLRNESEK